MDPEIFRYSAFTRDPAGGNPAGVVLDATGLTDDDLQRIAAEVGFSETAFCWPADAGEDNTHRVQIRYFSPRAEVAFCGHATVATAIALADAAPAITFVTPVGEVPVRLLESPEGLVAELTSVPTRTTVLAPTDLDELLAAVRLEDRDLHPDHPPRLGYAGNRHPIVVLDSRERLADLDEDLDRVLELCRRHDWTTVDLAWPESERMWHCRNLFPVGGVREDPATGAAAAAFGGYLRHTRSVVGDVTVHQGEDMGRPSLLHVTTTSGSDRVAVAGAAVRL